METRFDEMKRYVRFTEEDAARVAELLPLARPHFERIATEFYERIREHEAAHAVFADEAQIARLQRSLVAWLERLLGGRYDEAYFRQTERIGQVHVVVGLPQRYMFLAMGLIRSSLGRIIGDVAPEGVSARARDALHRLIDLELAIMLESYREDLMAKAERAIEDRVALQRSQQQERIAAMGRLVAGLAHEIRNPLNGAQLHVSVLHKLLAADSGLVLDEARDAASVVETQLKRLARLLTAFLDFARPRPLVREPVSLRELLQCTVELVGAASEGVRVRAEVPPEDVFLSGDRPRLLQALGSLTSNAIEAVRPHGGTVILRAGHTPAEAWIEVEDDGGGIPHEGTSIFDPFYSTRDNAIGLGLPIALQAAHEHGGRIDVESKPGRTRFRVVLPRAA